MRLSSLTPSGLWLHEQDPIKLAAGDHTLEFRFRPEERLEETQLQKRVEQAGGCLYYHPQISIRHHVGSERITPAWLYRRYFWGGVSDHVMRQTLRSMPPGAGSGAPAGLNRNARFSEQLGRLANNLWASLGVFTSRRKTIHGRIYMAYVLGRIRGILC